MEIENYLVELTSNRDVEKAKTELNIKSDEILWDFLEKWDAASEDEIEQLLALTAQEVINAQS